jgi:N6-L-threonylcarbamoyladenine synthase
MVSAKPRMIAAPGALLNPTKHPSINRSVPILLSILDPGTQPLHDPRSARRVLGIETSCDETGVAVFDSQSGLIAHTVFSQITLHAEYGGVVPELASRDHIRRLLVLLRKTLNGSGVALSQLDAVAYTQGPGLAGALLVGAATASALAYALRIPALPVHHLEGHLLSPLLSVPTPSFPYLCLLVSGGHTQLLRIGGVGRYQILGETLDDAAGEAFDKTAQLLGLGYPGGPALARVAAQGRPDRFQLPRPMIASGNFDFSFSGLKTAVMTLLRRTELNDATRADVAASFQAAIVDVLAAKARTALERTGLRQLVIAGGVGANQALRDRLERLGAERDVRVYYPPLEFCTDNGAMIALAGSLRLEGHSASGHHGFSVRPRWNLESLTVAA